MFLLVVALWWFNSRGGGGGRCRLEGVRMENYNYRTGSGVHLSIASGSYQHWRAVPANIKRNYYMKDFPWKIHDLLNIRQEVKIL